MTTIYIILAAFAAGITFACLLSSLLNRRPKKDPEKYWTDMLRQINDEPELTPRWRKGYRHLRELGGTKR